MGWGENLTAFLRLLYGRTAWPTGSSVDRAPQGSSLGGWKVAGTSPKAIWGSHEVAGGRLKLLYAPCRKVPRCPPVPPDSVSVRFRRGSTGLWRFKIWIN